MDFKDFPSTSSKVMMALTCLVAISVIGYGAWYLVKLITTPIAEQEPKVIKVASIDNVMYTKEIHPDGIVYLMSPEGKTQLHYQNYDNATNALQLKDNTPHDVFTYLPDYHEVIDPTSLGLYEDIPYTYTSTVKESEKYLSSAVADGWKVESYFCDTSICDYYLSLDESVLRLIISSHTLKLLPEATLINKSLEDYFLK